MNSQELKEKIDLLDERAEKLAGRESYEMEDSVQNKEWNCLIEGICECLPVLWAAREVPSTVWTLLGLLRFYGLHHLENVHQYPAIVDTLNSFAVAHEDWQRVEAYAEEETETTADFEVHTMAVEARKIVSTLKQIPFETDGKLRARAENSGQFIVDTFDDSSAAFGITQGVHYFETLVLICTNRLHRSADLKAQMGWNTRRWKDSDWLTDEGLPIDGENLLQSAYEPIDEQHSIGFSGYFPSGTVLGCLLDLTQRTFAFTVNGREVPFKESVPFSSNAYYVFARGASMYCNFGQVPFKYPPAHLAAYSATELAQQANKYALYEYITMMPLIDNRVEPYFSDAKQGKVKQTLEQLWQEGDIRTEKVEETYAQLWKGETFHRQTYCLRWLQALIEMETVDEGKLSEWTSLVEMLLNLTTDENWILLSFLEPYSKLRERVSNWPLYRTLAILFTILLQCKTPDDVSYFLSSGFDSFLLAAFLTTPDHTTAMFSLIGLATVQKGKREELSSTEFKEKLQRWKRQIEHYRGREIHSEAQLKLVIYHFERLLQSSPSAPVPTPTDTSLSPSAASPQAKLSPDCLSLRSDFEWQSACSHLAVVHSPSLPFSVFFFEATLLTSGPMRIGWATKRWQVLDSVVGGNASSFGYDGHTGCIWYQDVQWRVSNVPKWKAGDVIGCLLDLATKQFTFYQNGEAIQLNGEIYSRVSKEIEFVNEERMVHVYERNASLKPMKPANSLLPYTAALSLSAYQQVSVNLGSTSFRFPECTAQLGDYPDYWDFQLYSEYLEEHRPNKRPKIVYNNSIGSADNSLITIGGKTVSEDVTLISERKTGKLPVKTDHPEVMLIPVNSFAHSFDN